MSKELSQPEAVFGYLSTIESTEHGYFGGFLLISVLGRPLEFHCTAPVRPSRAQEILFGPTLHSYLLGEQIGGALLASAKLQADVILVDRPAMCEFRRAVETPVVLVINADAANEGASGLDRVMTIGDSRLQLSYGSDAHEAQVVELLTALSEYVELTEPFGRIHEAIREAQRLGSRSGDTPAQAA